MKSLLSKSRLDKMRRVLYGRSVEAVFYGVTPEAGESEIGRITSGFHFLRERAKEGDDNGRVKFWLSTDAAIDREDLRVGAAMALIIDGRESRYSIHELLPQQQIGAGYVLRLTPKTGATG
jgi:hypothetical protein